MQVSESPYVMKPLFIIATCCLMAGFSNLQAQAPKIKKVSTKVPSKSLFNADEVVSLTLVANLSGLLKDRSSQTPASYKAAFSYVDAPRNSLALPIKLMVRGNFRRDAKHCRFPPLLLDFPKTKTVNTPFARHAKLKLVTHCQTEEYVVREYLVYKLYNLLTDFSFRARLAKVTYQDSSGKRATETKYGFLLEDEASVARRNKATPYPPNKLNMARADTVQMATVAVFEYLIGNTDWSVPFRHNIRLFSNPKRTRPMPVPYDFDHSGIVEAPYAYPAEQLAIQSVRQRLYRGYGYPQAVFDRVFKKFKKHKAAIYALYQNQPTLPPGYVKRTLKYLDEFYETIDSPRLVKRLFVEQGQQNLAGGVVIKGLN